MPQGYAYSQNMATCCMCIPLRMGVFLNACITISTSLNALFFKGQRWLRLIQGGYALESRVILGAIECCGLVWGVMGLLGAWTNRTSYVIIYNRFQAVRIAAWIGMYLVDVPLLWNCELWITDINKALKTEGWNPIMYNVAMGSKCIEERQLFFMISPVCLVVMMYFWYASWRLQKLQEYEPRYLLRIPKDVPSGSFYAQGLGERAQLVPFREETPWWNFPRPFAAGPGVPGGALAPGPPPPGPRGLPPGVGPYGAPPPGAYPAPGLPPGAYPAPGPLPPGAYPAPGPPLGPSGTAQFV